MDYNINGTINILSLNFILNSIQLILLYLLLKLVYNKRITISYHFHSSFIQTILNYIWILICFIYSMNQMTSKLDDSFNQNRSIMMDILFDAVILYVITVTSLVLFNIYFCLKI